MSTPTFEVLFTDEVNLFVSFGLDHAFQELQRHLLRFLYRLVDNRLCIKLEIDYEDRFGYPGGTSLDSATLSTPVEVVPEQYEDWLCQMIHILYTKLQRFHSEGATVELLKRYSVIKF